MSEEIEDESKKLLLNTSEKRIIDLEAQNRHLRKDNRELKRENNDLFKQLKKGTLQIIVDKTSAVSICMVIILIGIFVLEAIAFYEGGIEAAIAMWSIVGWFLPIIAVFFGLSNIADVKKLMQKIWEKLTEDRV